MVKLFDYQEAALSKLHNGSILWGGVGSGKSVTGIAYYEKVRRGLDRPLPLYIITTARKRDTGEWEGDLAKFCLKAKVDSWNNIRKYTDVKQAFFLFDEQRVVGYGAWTKSFLKIAAGNRWILLSATPGDCWMDYLPVFIANGYFRNKTEFQRMHVVYNRFNTRYPQIKGYLNERVLRRYRDEILVGMTYEKKTVPHHIVVKTAYNKKLYDTVMRERINPFTEAPIKEASELCLALRRICNEDADRIDKVLDILLRHSKVIIFYNYDYELEILRQEFIDRNFIGQRWPEAEWNGHRHEPIPKGDRWVYLVQYTAGAEGWNCIETDTIIFYSQNYSYKTMVQAAGRIDRLNTGYHDLYYYYLTTDSKIDMAIRRALAGKKSFNESAFAGKMQRV